jgi:hypothetical protein
MQWKGTNKMGKKQPNYEMHVNELGQKKDHPKDPFIGYQWRTK